MLNRCSVLGFLAFISSARTFIKQIGAIKLVKLIYVFSSIAVAYVANFLRKRDKGGIYRETSFKSKRDIIRSKKYIMNDTSFFFKEYLRKILIIIHIVFKYINFFLLFQRIPF